ncbi:MAG: outer membrane protein [Propylenella sp.]
MLRPIVSVSALALFAGVAAAADLPPPITVAPPSVLTAPTLLAFSFSGFYFGGHGGFGFGDGAFTDGAISGGQVGVNWQYGAFLFGFEADGSWADWSDVASVQSLRMRGGLALDRLLAYGTFGVANKDFVKLVGWIAGAGVEYALTDRWIIGVEYLHYDFAADDSEVIRGRVSYLFGGL